MFIAFKVLVSILVVIFCVKKLNNGEKLTLQELILLSLYASTF